jgi:hypothetical protein
MISPPEIGTVVVWKISSVFVFVIALKMIRDFWFRILFSFLLLLILQSEVTIRVRAITQKISAGFSCKKNIIACCWFRVLLDFFS